MCAIDSGEAAMALHWKLVQAPIQRQRLGGKMNGPGVIAAGSGTARVFIEFWLMFIYPQGLTSAGQ